MKKGQIILQINGSLIRLGILLTNCGGSESSKEYTVYWFHNFGNPSRGCAASRRFRYSGDAIAPFTDMSQVPKIYHGH